MRQMDWPHVFADSRRWCFLTLRPGTEPVRALVEAFLDTWQLDRTSTEWPTRRAEWVDALLGRKLTLRDLLDQTGRRYAELQRSEPPAFFLYIDQGEELYVRAVERERRCFSEILAGGLGEPRLRGLMSMRADFFGELQKDEPLHDVSRKIEVPPLREAQLLEVVKPAGRASVRPLRDRASCRRHRPACRRGIGQGCRRVAAALLPPRRHVAKHGRARRR